MTCWLLISQLEFVWLRNSLACVAAVGVGDPSLDATTIHKFILAPSNFVKLKSMMFFVFQKSNPQFKVISEIR